MRSVVINVTTNVFWMYFPVAAIWFSLFLSGHGDSAFEGPGFIFVACVMYGVSIQKLNELPVVDRWAYMLFFVIGFSLSLIMAVIISYDTYTAFDVLRDDIYIAYIQLGLAIFSIIASAMVSKLELKYHQKNQQEPAAETR